MASRSSDQTTFLKEVWRNVGPVEPDVEAKLSDVNLPLHELLSDSGLASGVLAESILKVLDEVRRDTQPISAFASSI